MADGYVYRVVGKRRNDGEWQPVRPRTYADLGTAKGIATRTRERFYTDVKVQASPVIWLDVEG